MSTQIYERNFAKLTKIFNLSELSYEDEILIKSGAFEDLSIDLLWVGNGYMEIAMDQHYIQNGDLMFDPEMRLRVYPDRKIVEALTYRQDGLGIYQEVYQFDDDGNATYVNPTLKKQLNAFLGTWLTQLINNGFKSSEKVADEEGVKTLKTFMGI